LEVGLAGPFTLTTDNRLRFSTSGPSRLTVRGNLSLQSAGILDFRLNSPSAFDRLTVMGTVNINNTQLSATLGAGFTPSAGTRFTILDNRIASPTVGTFRGLPHGATLTISGRPFRILYNVGTGGNDVVLEAL
jgi:hypothetical protein